MPYQIVRNDITQMQVDAIVNPTDPMFSGSGGTDAQIHRIAGSKLREACNRLPYLEQGQTAVTKGYQLPCRYVIHTVGPVWHDGTQGEKETLYACYHNALETAAQYRCETVAFPLIASGTFGYPKDKVLRIALEAIGDFLMTHDMIVYIVVYDKESYAVSKKLQADVQSYIDEHYIKRETLQRYIHILEEAKIIYPCYRFDLKSRKSIAGEQKYYLADLGFYFSMNTDKRINYGPAMENIVYTYAKSKGYNISVGRIGKLECDFILERHSTDYAYVQVAMTIMDSITTEDREYRALEQIRDNYPKYLVTRNDLIQHRNGIHHVNIAPFMKNNGLFE